MKPKISFATYTEAFTELRRIIDTNYNTCKAVKPNRVYLDPRDNLFYLTSKLKITTYEK